ncbi:hypothetical protein ACLOJK_027780 [Asimina triloba]
MNHHLHLHLLLPLTLLLSSSLIFSCTHAAAAAELQHNDTDQLALLAFKHGITHDPTRALHSWNRSLHFCHWTGITCTTTPPPHPPWPRVTALNLTGRSLAGGLSPHLANLTFLTAIHLSHNQLHGLIPTQLGRLFRLRFLNLSYNSFGGGIPSQLGNCSHLQILDLEGNTNIQGSIPAQLGSLSNLVQLNLQSNSFTGGIPSSIGNISSLRHLVLSSNLLLGGRIPHELGRLRRLEEMGLSLCALSGEIPPALFNLSSLLFFAAAENQLQGILPQTLGITLPNIRFLHLGSNRFAGRLPASLGNASNLQRLDFSNNSFSGPIMPANLGRLTRLRSLNLPYNKLTDGFGFLTSLTNCSDLVMLRCAHNNLSGELPNSIANLSTHLTELWLSFNQISGRIPSGVENLIGLHRLKMSYSNLEGPIPHSFGRLKNLEILAMGKNKHSQQIPVSLGNATQLIALYLEGNRFNGSVPLSFGGLRHLQILNLSGNCLSGTIPKQVLSLSSLSVFLDLSGNSFTGKLPSEIGSLNQLASLNVSSNKLSGEIPTSLGDCRSLVELSMEDNSFQGTIPHSLSNLGGIERLDLSNNNFSGEIPPYLGMLPSLQYLNLSFNSLEGQLPTDGVFKNASMISVQGNRDVCVVVPVLPLPSCSIHALKHKGKSLQLKVLTPVIGGSVLLALLICSSAILVSWIRQSRKKSPTSVPFLGQMLKLSYSDLLQATDRFSSVNLLGRGSFGSVYRGVLNDGDMAVAIKVLDHHDRHGLKTFLAECQAMVNIRHQNLVKVITACSSIDFKGNDFKALVLEYMPNGSLEEWLHPDDNGQNDLVRNLILIERLGIAIDVASALEYLHHHGDVPIVHRDLKPGNVLLDNDMIAHVADFGFAKLLNGINCNSPKGQTSSVMTGTVGYVAPEFGLDGKASTAGDVYSYGILLLEMFTGCRPTDSMFEDGLSLHQLVKMALPERVMEIVDPLILLDDGVYESNEEMRGRIEECLVSILEIGVACSVVLPSARMKMVDVVVALKVIRDAFLGVGIHRQRWERV